MSTTELNPTQRFILDAAIQHTGGRIERFPDNIKGGARSKVLDGLFNRALITRDGDGWCVAAEGYDAMNHPRPGINPKRISAFEANLDRIIANAETDEIGSLVIIPLHLAKGLEFDVVVLADIDEETYPADTLHARLLYVGITRAAHQLVVNWVGRPSPLLESSTPVIDLAEPFAQVMEPNPVTIADFASSHPNLEPAWCVERLARREKLNLLRNGRIDQTVAAMLLGTDEKEPRRTTRGLIQPLDIQTRSTITERVRSLNFERKTQSGLALTQLTFSLLRHQMRSFGLTLDGEAENTLEDQVVALCTFQQYLDGDSSGLTPGRWTTERTVLELVLKNRREQALIFLNMLIDFGIVERSNEQIRVRSDQIGELLVLALGGTAANWDPDLIAQLSMPPQLNASATEPAGTSHGD